MRTTRQIEIDDTLPPDLIHLCLLFLKGDTSAADLMVDCYIENKKQMERITPVYIERLEELLQWIKNVLRKSEMPQSDGMCLVGTAQSREFHRNYQKLVMDGVALGRSTLC